MLTIRHIEVSGHEEIMTTPRVSYHPRTPEMTRECVFWETVSGQTIEMDSGTVYVMNENGKTVAVYRFADCVAPQS